MSPAKVAFFSLFLAMLCLLVPSRACAELEIREGATPMPWLRLVQKLGEGGFGQVWEAEVTEARQGLNVGDRVAIKFIPAKRGQTGVTEASMYVRLQGLNHPGTIKLYGYAAAEGYNIVVMEKAIASLHDYLSIHIEESGGAFCPAETCRLLWPIAQTLDDLNDRRHPVRGVRMSLMHRDAKPANMFIVGDAGEEVVKLGDFGLAMMISQARIALPEKDRGGTPEFTPPEMYRGYLTQQSDQYSLGISFLELTLGRVPIASIPGSFVLPPGQQPPRADLSGVPVAVQPAIARALSPEPINRYPNCKAMMEALARASGTTLANPTFR